YVSDPCSTSIGIRTYEHLALLAAIVNKVYINKEWVAQDYLRRCNAGAWKRELDEDATKCWNMEPILHAVLVDVPAPAVMMVKDLLHEDSSSDRGASAGGEVESGDS
ncbi:hypothetical protein ACHAWF_001632, partial [Thalassiosira exigua]